MNNGWRDFVRLKSVFWTKPGIVEIEITQRVSIEAADSVSVPDPASFTGFTEAEFVGRSEKREDNIVTFEWRFIKGKQTERSKTDRSPSDLHSEIWAMTSVLQEKSLIDHPKIESIVSEFNGYIADGEVYFNRYLIVKDGSAKKNPYYGTKTFLIPTVDLTLKKEKQMGKIDFGVIDGVGYSKVGGEVQEPPSSGFNFIRIQAKKERRPWLLLSHDYSSDRAGCTETKTWRFGGDRGWPDQVYDDGYEFGDNKATKD